MHTRTPTPQDLDTLSLQLGRPVRDVVEIGARCVCGNPLVATTAPRLSSGIPFPTTFYLTHPVITAAVSRLEAEGEMSRMSERLREDEQLAAQYRAAHESYLSAREQIRERSGIDPVPEIAGVSAGGMPERVKCLHVLVGHALAEGPGANVLGDEALEKIAPWWNAQECFCADAWNQNAPVPTRDLSRHVKTQEEKRGGKARQKAQRRRAQDDGGARAVAAIDCGTNSLRLLIAREGEGDALTELAREMRVVRLGEGVDTTGELSEAALKRTFAALGEYAKLIEQHHVGRIRAVATSATRDARNRHEFVQGFKDILGVEPEVISGTEEAQLSFSGALSALRPDAAEPVLVVDLGGGSTEFVLGTQAAPQVSGSQSVDMGCVRFTERYLSQLPPSPQEQDAVREQVQLLLSDLDVDLEAVRTLVGVAGTITTVTACALGLDRYSSERINGAQLSVAQIDAACQKLIDMDREQLAALGFMHPGRVDVITAGALMWQSIVRTLSELDDAVTSATTSEHDILDGIALSMFAAPTEAAKTDDGPKTNDEARG